MKTYYTTWQIPFYKNPTGEAKHRDIPLNTLLETEGDELNGRTLVTDGKVAGWVNSDLISPYVEQLPKNVVNLSGLQTVSPNDAEQFLTIDGVRVVNPCGQISLAYCYGLEIAEVINRWKVGNPNHYRAVTRAGWTTAVSDLETIADTLPGTHDLLKLPRWNQGDVYELLKENHIIASVRINGNTGRMGGSVWHWVVITDVFVERFNYGTVDVFNPFPNRIERYGWAELALYRPVGLLVRKLPRMDGHVMIDGKCVTV